MTAFDRVLVGDEYLSFLHRPGIKTTVTTLYAKHKGNNAAYRVVGYEEPSEYLIRINAPHFVAGIVLFGESVVRAAPIVHYMSTWNKQRVLDYCNKRQWVTEII